MSIRLTAATLLFATTLTGCDKFIRTNTATIMIDGLPGNRSQQAILFDPALRPETNESGGPNLFLNTKQSAVVNFDCPVKLIPDESEPPIDKVATSHTATIVINGPRTTEPIYPILIDPRLKPDVNETRRVRDFWGIDITQQIKVKSRVPLRLVPATNEELRSLGAEPVQ